VVDDRRAVNFHAISDRVDREAAQVELTNLMMSPSRSRRCKVFESRPFSSLKSPSSFIGGCWHVLFTAGDEHSLAIDPCWRRASATVEGFESRPIRSTKFE
jgi:hypothetical protein